MAKQLDKIYYNTEYRKKVKSLSKFNIYIKDRISKKDVIQEVKLTKKKILFVPLIFKKLFSRYFYKLIENFYNVSIGRTSYNFGFVLRFYTGKKKEKLHVYMKNQLVLEFFFNGVIIYLFILNWLWTNEWNKWISLTEILDHNFFDLKIIIKYIYDYFSEFFSLIVGPYNELFKGFFFDLTFNETFINVYNLHIFNFLKVYYFLFNIEEIKFEHDTNFVKKKDWKNIKKATFDFFGLDTLNDYFNLSFFSFSIYEFNIMSFFYKYNYVTVIFFEYWIDVIMEKNYNEYNILDFEFKTFNLKNLQTKVLYKKNFAARIRYNLFLSILIISFFIRILYIIFI